MEMNENEIDIIISAYFTMREYGFCKMEDQLVVDVLKNYPQYANYYLTYEEREGDGNEIHS